MKAVREIAEKIQLPEEVTERLGEIEREQALKVQEPYIRRLTDSAEYSQAVVELKELLNLDKNGIKMLYCMLWAASYAWEKYEEAGISEEIYQATMKCFSRFVGEHKASYGVYGFDREFWTGRQVSLLLFRIGELEYEKIIENGERRISVHIPSDADLDLEKCRASIHASRAFFEKYDRAFAGVPYVCQSWLLSPALKELLPGTSRILQFQDLFVIEKVEKEEKSYLEWVYKNRDFSDVEELPEETSLQRRMKKHLLAGGWVGEGEGRLKEGI